MTKLTLPAAEEIFRSRPPRMAHPAIVRVGDSPAMEVADREVARLLINAALFDPPILDSEIKLYARRFKMPFRKAEIEVRRLRNA